MYQKITYCGCNFHIAVFNGVCEIRHNSERGLLVAKMDRWAWMNCFQSVEQQKQLFNVILKWFFN